MKKLTRHGDRFKGLTVGLDVHQRFIQYVILDRKGDEIAGGRVPGNRAGLEEVRKEVGRRKTQYVLEAGRSFFWVFDALVARVGRERVHVAQPHRIRPIANSLEKNDANDAWWLAYLCSEGRLPEAYVAEGAIRELRIATREHRTAVDRRADLVRRLHSHLAQAGLKLSTRNFHAVRAREEARSLLPSVPGVRRKALRRLLKSIGQGDEEVSWWEKEVRRLSEGLPEVSAMEAGISGVGPTIASVLVAELGDPRRFRSAKAFARATGLVPGFRESGGRRRSVGMSRAGSSRARWALTRAVIACLRCRRGPGVQVRSWVLRRCRSRPKRKVIVAAARKLAEGVWRLFAYGECFDLAKAFPAPAV